MNKCELLQLSKECTIEHITGSCLITSKPCFVFTVNVYPTTPGTVATFYLRNGEIVTSDILFGFKLTYGVLGFSPNLPCYFNKGLYVEFNSNVAGATLQYLLTH